MTESETILTPSKVPGNLQGTQYATGVGRVGRSGILRSAVEWISARSTYSLHPRTIGSDCANWRTLRPAAMAATSMPFVLATYPVTGLGYRLNMTAGTT